MRSSLHAIYYPAVPIPIGNVCLPKKMIKIDLLLNGESNFEAMSDLTEAENIPEQDVLPRADETEAMEKDQEAGVEF